MVFRGNGGWISGSVVTDGFFEGGKGGGGRGGQLIEN